MECPYCKQEMEEGYIPFNSPFILKWVSLRDKKKKVRVSAKLRWSEVAKIKRVYRCEACGVLMKSLAE